MEHCIKEDMKITVYFMNGFVVKFKLSEDVFYDLMQLVEKKQGSMTNAFQGKMTNTWSDGE